MACCGQWQDKASWAVGLRGTSGASSSEAQGSGVAQEQLPSDTTLQGLQHMHRDVAGSKAKETPPPSKGGFGSQF